MVLLSEKIIYPESDGKPMADNTEQFNWIVLIKENLEILFARDPLVFVAGDLLWYPVEGNNKLCQAPDALVVLGRPKGKRSSYQQWKEEHIPPQVVFEILSPGNRFSEMLKKFDFYQRYGVQEYYLYDPDKNDLSGWLRVENNLEMIEDINHWLSPILGIRFIVTEETLEIYGPNEQKFLSPLELSQRADQEFQGRLQAEQEKEVQRQRAEQELQARLQAEQRVEHMRAKMLRLGLDPD